MEVVKSIFVSYDKTISRSYDRFFQGLIDNNIKDTNIDTENMKQAINEASYRWMITPIQELNGGTPLEFFQNLTNVKDAFKLWTEAIQCCDHDIPEVFMDKFKSFGEEAEDAQIELLTKYSLELKIKDEGQRTLFLAVIKLLGEWKVSKSVTNIIEVCLKAEEEDDLLLETCRNALAQIGNSSIKPLSELLVGVQSINFNERYEQLLLALAEAGSRNKSDELFNLIKSVFREIPNKLVGADSFLKYGDARGIPVLRGYLERNLRGMDKNTFYEIKAAIQKLGGQTNDLVDLYMSQRGK